MNNVFNRATDKRLKHKRAAQTAHTTITNEESESLQQQLQQTITKLADVKPGTEAQAREQLTELHTQHQQVLAKCKLTPPHE